MHNGGPFEALLELIFYTKPPNFGVEAHMEAPTGVALSLSDPSTPLLAITKQTCLMHNNIHNLGWEN
jgi:hypothetical protein